jgi:putative transcriptional regulator
MAIVYDRLFKLLDKRDRKISEFRYSKTLSSATIAKLRKNQPVNISVLDTLCKSLGCNLNDICEYIPDKTPSSDDNDPDVPFI